MGHGAADLDVRHQRVLRLDQERTPAQAWCALDGHAALLEITDTCGFNRRQDVDRAGQQRGLGGTGVGNDAEDDDVGVGRAGAGIAVLLLGRRLVAVMALQRDEVAALPFLQLVRSGSHRRDPLAVGPGAGRMGDEHVTLHIGELLEEDRLRRCERIDDGRRIGRFDGQHLRPGTAVKTALAPPAGLRHQPVPGPFDFGRGHGGAIVEAGAVAQLERIGLAVVRHRPRLCQRRTDAEIGAVRDQPLEQDLHHRVGVGVAVDAWLDAADIGIEREGERTATLLCRGWRSERQGREGRQRDPSHHCPAPCALSFSGRPRRIRPQENPRPRGSSARPSAPPPARYRGARRCRLPRSSP